MAGLTMYTIKVSIRFNNTLLSGRVAIETFIQQTVNKTELRASLASETILEKASMQVSSNIVNNSKDPAKQHENLKEARQKP
ncbi:MAG: hypothetical protein FWH40_06735 [Coriobacteriia bacterium]|nr:hypothetical protein [Coriobacteriia bacterium]